MFPHGSACVFIVYVVKTSICNYFAKTRCSWFELRVYSLYCLIMSAHFISTSGTEIHNFSRYVLPENVIQIYVYIHFEEKECVTW